MDGEALEAARSEAMAADRCFSKGRLRDEFRMKPRPDVLPVKFYKDGYGGKFGVYRIADCVPIRERAAKPASEKQQRVRAILAIKAKLRSNQAVASGIAGAWLAAAPLFLDTESTGLGSDAQIIELAITDACGNVLLESRLRPTVPIEPGALAVHGIDDQALADAPTWPQIAGDVQGLLRGRVVVIFNEEFDARMVQQTAAAFGESTDWWREVDACCAMYLAADTYGATNRYGTISLADATYVAGVTWPGRAHSAAVDALVTAELVKAIAAIRARLDQELAGLIVSEEVTPC
jgi:DNA polymerase-3 subunit epsilon